jgi:type II secretory pathway predicted ATPase ExeA
MAKNHADLREALLDSSGYLADLLARCAFIEDQFYRGIESAIANVEKEKSIVRIYVAILQYSAQVRRVQQYSKGRDIVESLTAVTSQQLAQLKTLIKEEESHLHHWLLMDQHLHRKAEAENILTHIDIIMMTTKRVHEAVAMFNLPFVDSALFDSFTDRNEDKCLPGTRQELLQQVQHWGRSSDRGIFWLSGMAGTGKSTIARTLAQSFKDKGTLGASFFFKRNKEDRATAAKFFPTIVKQLAIHIPQMIAGIQKAIEDDPAIVKKTLPEQFDKLMLQPLLAVDQGQAVSSTLIVIDALDECEPNEDVKIILTLLEQVVTATSMAIRFFLTSRPEQLFRFKFKEIGERHVQHIPLDKVHDVMTKHDITLYLREKFSEIQKNPEHNLPRAWPGEEQIETLATRATPLFIFAATVYRFVADSRFDPEERLQEFLTNSSGSKLDKTYRPVLKHLLADDGSDREKLIGEFQKIIGVIILLADPLSVSSLAELLELEEHKISIRLRSFHSVLIIPSNRNLPIQTFHSSFHDYLLDEGTRTNTEISRFWVDKGEKHELITRQCLSVMGRYLKKNICGLPSYGTSRTGIDPASVARLLPPALQYACHYWVYHLSQSTAPARILDQALLFLKEHFLHWIESMSILGLMSGTLDAVDTLINWAKVSLLVTQWS